MSRHPQRVPSRVSSPEASQALFEQHVLPEIEVLLRVARSLTRIAEQGPAGFENHSADGADRGFPAAL